MKEAWLQQIPRIASSAPGVSGLAGGAPAWALAALARAPEAASKGLPFSLPFWVVTATSDEADRVLRELRFHLGEDARVQVALFPADDVRPYEGLSPHPGIPRQRLAALDLLSRGAPAVVVAPARALAHRVLAPEVLAANRVELAPGQEVDRAALVRRLVDWGYLATGLCEEPGTVARRGGVLDLWPAGRDKPVRIEMFDDEIEEIKSLDPSNQRSYGAPLKRLRLLPAREGLLSPEALSRAAEVLAAAVDAQGAGHARRRRALQDLREGLWFPAAEDYLPALHSLVAPLDYGRPAVVIGRGAVEAELHKFAANVASRWAAEAPEDRPPLPPDARYLPAEAVITALQPALALEPFAPDAPDVGARDNRSLKVGAGDLAPLVQTLRGWLAEDWQVVLVCDTRARSERLVALLGPHGLRPRPLPAPQLPPPGVLGLWMGDLPRGFHAETSRLAIIVDDELFAARSHARRPATTLREAAVTSFAQLKVGDLVVHARHGIGRFEGLTRLPVQMAQDAVWGIERAPGEKVEQDFALVSYRDGDRLYLPVTRLDQLSRYQAVGDTLPKLDKLGGESWAKRKAKVRDRVLAMAHELLRLHAMRAVATSHAFEGSPPLYQQFEEMFPYVETPDQEAAIDDVLADLAKPEPMDRLIIGDVGFGKTEVAMRAAMRVLLDGYQVGVLCPTTVLAFQHFESFKARFAEMPVNIELLSRFRSAADSKAVLKAAEAGRVDILIGTTALLGRDLRFRKLGLLVIDEEHRFGVRQKDRLKRLRTDVDYLAMSATPIPRSLHMALSGLRKVSVIATPPADRQAIRTRVARRNEALIRDEILHELRRGGQVFFVHNRVASIGRVADELARLVPEARVSLAHGQMDAESLERVLVGFLRRDSNVLVCTAIVESGVDMPNVNTMIVDSAENFGLAQLYQLRGRVGRGAVRGNCILMVPETGQLSRDAMRRLQVLQENTELGAGFAIANADLELRGSGNLLGDDQHGHIEAVGLETYVELLEDAVAEARGDLSRQRLDPELEIPVPALLPESYIPEMDARLNEYRRLAVARTVHQVRDLVEGWEDRFGPAPPEVLNLGWMGEARVRCRDLGLQRITWLKVRAVLDFHESTTVPPARVAALVAREPSRFALPKASAKTAGWRLEVRFTPEEAAWPFRFLHWVFGRLQED